MKINELMEIVKEKMTVDEVLKLVEQIAASANCSPAEAFEKLEEARKATVS